MVVTPLAKHKKIGKDVIPPYAELLRKANVQRGDWTGERLPQMLWAALLIAAVGRDEALERFRRLAQYISDRSDGDEECGKVLRYVTLSGLTKWNDEDFAGFVAAVIGGAGAIFSDLLRFDDLPGKERWVAVVPPPGDSLDLLKRAIAFTIWHQTQEATDIRWMKVFAATVSGTFHLPTKEHYDEILDYPNHGDMHKVRPGIRSKEGAIDMMPPGIVSDWPKRFWKQAYDLTKADHVRYSPEPAAGPSTITPEEAKRVRDALLAHCEATTADTSVDPRHEACFGFACYALTLLCEALTGENASSINGRQILRSLTEVLINFSVLAKRDETDRWQAFRNYGYGQAKLAYLKALESEEVPTFATIESLEGLSNEDVWHEFREIHIGNWNDSDLRTMSESVGLKDQVYDKYYDWSSAFVHGNWAAIRDACYDLCLNPLHRLHRVLAVEPKRLSDVVADAVHVVNKILALVDALYPPFAERFVEPARPPAVEGS